MVHDKYPLLESNLILKGRSVEKSGYEIVKVPIQPSWEVYRATKAKLLYLHTHDVEQGYTISGNGIT